MPRNRSEKVPRPLEGWPQWAVGILQADAQGCINKKILAVDIREGTYSWENSLGQAFYDHLSLAQRTKFAKLTSQSRIATREYVAHYMEYLHAAQSK